MATSLPFFFIYKVKIYTPEKSYTIPERSYMNHTYTDNNRVVFYKGLKISFDFKILYILHTTLKIFLVDRGYSTILLKNIFGKG